MHKILFYNKFIIAPTCFEHCCVHHQEVKIVLYSIWYHHTCRWPSGAQFERRPSTCTPDGHLQVWWYQMLYNTHLTSWWWAQQCSKHVGAYNKLIIKQEFVHKLVKLLRLNLTIHYTVVRCVMVSVQYRNIGGINCLLLQDNGFLLTASFFSSLERNFVHISCKFTVVGVPPGANPSF